jgi:2',3'-cyclic-nucleotide 2'-phosphodiesterase
VRLLFIADIFGRPGREAVEAHVPRLREELDLDLVIANGENAADGAGITDRLADRILASGVDCITLGNHTWHQRGFGSYLDREQRIVRPGNYLSSAPGRGSTIVEARDGTRVAVINLLGRLFVHPEPACSPFELASGLVAEARAQAPIVVLDFHAEATSEKVAMGRHLAGKATAVLGTHTHIQTNDASLWDGTAYLSDCGMTGPHDSVIGVRTEIALRRFLTQLPARSEPGLGDVRLEGALLECDPENGRATRIETFRRQA